MSISTLLRARLVAGAGVSGRVYPNHLPQKPTYPAIKYQRISNSGQDGSSDNRQSRWQFDCWGRDYDAAVDLAATVKTLLEEWHDASEAPSVRWARVVNELDDYDDDTDSHRVIVDVILHTTGD